VITKHCMSSIRHRSAITQNNRRPQF